MTIKSYSAVQDTLKQGIAEHFKAFNVICKVEEDKEFKKFLDALYDTINEVIDGEFGMFITASQALLLPPTV